MSTNQPLIRFLDFVMLLKNLIKFFMVNRMPSFLHENALSIPSIVNSSVLVPSVSRRVLSFVLQYLATSRHNFGNGAIYGIIKASTILDWLSVSLKNCSFGILAIFYNVYIGLVCGHSVSLIWPRPSTNMAVGKATFSMVTMLSFMTPWSY